MNKIIKRIVSAVTAVTVTLTAVFVLDVPKMIAAEAATTSNCNGAHTGMTAWNGNTTIPIASGKYYLTTDVSLDARLEIPAGADITLCLNGYKVTQNNRDIKISGNLTLCDCKGNGMITGCKKNSSHSIRIENSGTFTMNGGKISGHENISEGTVIVCGGTFVMNGGEISNNSGPICGVYNFPYNGKSAKFTMNGGKITGNTTTPAWLPSGGGGVLNYSDCTFIMNGGEISGNTVNGTMDNGGGVHNSGSFTMNGGKITGNNAPNGDGGGVYNLGDATFIMDGGEISGNKAKNGGGVHASDPSCTFTMSGGKITGNSATSDGGGLYVGEQNVTLDGKVEISGNKVGETKNNVYISTGNTITIGNGFSTNSQIGVTTETAVSNCTTGVNITGTVNSDISSCFTPDVDGLSVLYRNNKIQLVKHSGLSTNWSKDDTNHWQTCTGCGVAGPKSEHTWNAGTVTTPATCTATGVKKFTCTVCNQTKTEDIPKTGHNTNGTVAHKDATCTTAGVVGGTYCTVCNNGKADAEKTIPMLPHTEVDDPAVAPTCTSIGKTAGKHCSVCGTITKAQETVSMLPHDWDGYQHDQDEHWQTCKNCGAKNNRAGHSWDGGTTVKEATEYAEGEMLYTCTVCAQTKTEPITKLPHTHKWSNEWTYNENYHWHECTEADLHESEVHSDEIPHDWKLSEVLKGATCTEIGMGKYVCNDCGAEKTEELAIDADAHDWESWTILLSPTLKTEGTARRVCTRSSDHTDAVNLPVLTDTTVWTPTEHVDPTEDNDGKDVYTSDEFGEVIYPLDKLPHTHKFPLTFVPEVKPTEDKEGVKEHWHCDGCGKDFYDKGGTQEATADDLRIGKIEAEIQAPDNVPTPEIATSKEELIEAALTDDEQKKVDEGKDIKIILKVEDATEKVTDSDKTAVTSEFSKMTNYKLGQYLDVTLLKKIGEEQEQKITETTAPIKVTFEIPAALRGKPDYSVIRVHNGTATVLSDLDSDPNTVTIETDKFSTYALTYKEKSSSSGSSGNSGSSGGDSHRPTYPDTSDTSDNTSSGTSENTSSDNSNNTSNDNSNNTSSETSGSTSSDNSGNTSSDNSGSMSSDNSDSASSDTSGNTSSDNSDSASSDTSGNTSSDNSDSASSETSGNTSSGNSGNSSDTTASNNEIRLIQSENNPPDNSGNPSTGIVVSLIPLATAAAVLTIVSKRKKK